MNRAIAMLLALSVVTASAEAQRQDTLPAVPGVKAPATFVLDTVLFRLPRANLAPGELVTLGERVPSPRIYSTVSVTSRERAFTRRCSLRMNGLVWLVDELKLRSDGVLVGETRLALGACGPARSSR